MPKKRGRRSTKAIGKVKHTVQKPKTVFGGKQDIKKIFQ